MVALAVAAITARKKVSVDFARMDSEPLGKACKKCVSDQNQKNVKKVSAVSEWPAIVRNNQIGEVLQEVTGLSANGGF